MIADHNKTRVAFALSVIPIDLAAMAYIGQGAFSTLTPLLYIPLGLAVLLLLNSLTGFVVRHVIVRYDRTPNESLLFTRDRFDEAVDLAVISNNRVFASKGLAVNVPELKTAMMKSMARNLAIGVEEEIGYLIGCLADAGLFVTKTSGIIGSVRDMASFISRCRYESAINEGGSLPPAASANNAKLYDMKLGIKTIVGGPWHGPTREIFVPNRNARLRLYSAMSEYNRGSASLLLLFLAGNINVRECSTI